MAQIEPYLHNLYRSRPEFVYDVLRDCMRSCATQMLVMHDNNPAHSYQASLDIEVLALNAQSTKYPRKGPKDPVQTTISQVRAFLRAHQPTE